ARESLRAGRYTEAAAIFDAVADDSSDPMTQADAWLGAGVARYQAGDLDGALVDLEAASTAGGLSPVGRRAAYLYGLRLLEAGRPADAAEALEPVVEEPSGDLLRPFAGSVYATALAADGREDDAGRVWDTVI